MIHWTAIIPALTAIALVALSQWSSGKSDPTATVYRYPRAFSLTMMFGPVLGATVVFWPGVVGDELGLIALRSFLAVFFLIGVALDFFRISLRADAIDQGYWPVRNVIRFQDVASIRKYKAIGDSYLLVTLNNGKRFKFEQSIENFDGLCRQVIDMARRHGVSDIVASD